MKAASRPTTAPEPTSAISSARVTLAAAPEGEFSLERFKDLIDEVPEIRMIEIKLSQGAKPGKGGILPGAKVTPDRQESAAFRWGKIA